VSTPFPNNQPLRREERRQRTRDQDGSTIESAVSQSETSLSPDDSIDEAVLEIVDQFYSCGCLLWNPPGGECAEPNCRRISCQKCFGRCASCQKPLCQQHSKFLDASNPNNRLCFDCFDELARRQTVRTVTRSLLGVFVDFESEEDSVS